MSASLKKATQFEVIVIGGGHAGTEAALAAARSGARTLLLTHNIETLGQMSCNPAIGGIGKGHLVKEIDALGGVMAHAADLAGIQVRILNARKGPAVRATRAQADRSLYKTAIRSSLENQPGLTLFQQAVDDLMVEGSSVKGVITQMGLKFYAPSVVLTVGTFLGGKIHVGLRQQTGGRFGDPPSIALAQRLRELPLRVDRLKTGTPPRIDARTIDFSELQEQPGDSPTPVFSYMGSVSDHPRQVSCHITYTNEHTHEIIRKGLDQSPLFTGVIEGVGPRYCPSIEDKIHRFSDKQRHQIFIEPEGLDTNEVYPNGISTSLSFETQYEFVRSIAGFEKAHITRPGYAIEYDFFDPQDLHATLETKVISGLFFAGQINGTTGYEEAAAQGLLAGINAALKAREREPWMLKRDQAYLGVMVDDLITRGTREPYRMFTSRAEHRLLLREDNADLRLTEMGRHLGLINDARWKFFCEKREAIEREKERLRRCWIQPHSHDAKFLTERHGCTMQREYNALELMRRPELNYDTVASLECVGFTEQNRQVTEQVEIQIKYAGYVERQQDEIAKSSKQENTAIPTGLDYSRVHGLSNEIVQKLTSHHPETLGQASRISGVTPAAISVLRIYLKKIGKLPKSA